MISITSKGSWSKTESSLKSMLKLDLTPILKRYGAIGVAALSAATPTDSGLASQSWDYVVERQGKTYSITWTNKDTENGFPVAIMLQYGHGTGTGGYIQGYDYINPAIRPIFDQIENEVWKVVTAA